MSGRRRIIILDDEDEIVELLRIQLGGDFDIVHFAATDCLLSYIDTDEFSSKETFLLVDILLGDEEDGGFNAVRRLTEEGIFLPLIFISNSNLEADVLKAAEVGSYAFVNKLRLRAVPADIRRALAQAEGAYIHRIREKIGKLNEWGNRAIVMVGSLEHEFGNLTIPIINSAQAIKVRCESVGKVEVDKIMKSADTILSAVSDATKLLNHTFSFVRGERDGGISLTSVDLVAITQRIAHRAIGDRGNELLFICSTDGFHCLVDEMKYIQIVSNLVANAIKYGADRGKIEVSLKIDQSEVDLSVRDFGSIKLTPREVRRLWLPLERGRAAEGIKGGGLGLTIVKQFAEMLGGRAYHSHPVGGSIGNIFGVILRIDLSRNDVKTPNGSDGT